MLIIQKHIFMAILQWWRKCYIADSESLKSKVRITGSTPTADNTKDAETPFIMIWSKFFLKTL